MYLCGGDQDTRLLCIRSPPGHMALSADRTGGRGGNPPAASGRHVRSPSRARPPSRLSPFSAAHDWRLYISFSCLPPPAITRYIPSLSEARGLSCASGPVSQRMATYGLTWLAGERAPITLYQLAHPRQRQGVTGSDSVRRVVRGDCRGCGGSIWGERMVLGGGAPTRCALVTGREMRGGVRLRAGRGRAAALGAPLPTLFLCLYFQRLSWTPRHARVPAAHQPGACLPVPGRAAVTRRRAPR